MNVYNPLKCPICNSDFNHPLCLDCGHVICSDCLNNLLTKKCPICNTIINSEQHPVVYCLDNPNIERIT